MKLSVFSMVVFLFFSCVNETNKSKNTTGGVSTESSKIDELKTEASRLRGGGSIKTVVLNGDEAKITYVSNYEEYKKLNPQSTLTETELKAYWESGDAIEKALIDGSVKIMLKLDFINQVSIILPFNKIVYEISVSKSELEKFIGTDFNSISKNWDELFSKPYVYDQKGRMMFFDKFGAKK